MNVTRNQTERMRRINKKIWLLYKLLNPKGQFENILVYNNSEDLLDNVIVLVKDIFHNIESTNREKTELLKLIGKLKGEIKKVDLTNQALKAENTALKREIKRKPKKKR